MFSHSMDTLVVRNYIQKYDNEIKKLILCGPPTDNKLVHIGLAMAYITSIFGYNKRNNFLNFITFNNFNKKYNYKNAWLSKNKRKSPVANRIPAFLAEDSPPFVLWITRTRLSFDAQASHIAPQLSGLPSSTRISS